LKTQKSRGLEFKLQHKIAFISLFKKEKENSGGANSH
jgi:hypothetical protein